MGNRLRGKIWEPTAFPCHERHHGTRCKLPADHTEYTPSKNPAIEELNGWHQSRTGVWKGDVFLTWSEFDAMRQRAVEASPGVPDGQEG